MHSRVSISCSENANCSQLAARNCRYRALYRKKHRVKCAGTRGPPTCGTYHLSLDTRALTFARTASSRGRGVLCARARAITKVPRIMRIIGCIVGKTYHYDADKVRTGGNNLANVARPRGKSSRAARSLKRNRLRRIKNHLAVRKL